MSPDVSPFGADVAKGPLSAFNTTYDALVYVIGRSAPINLRPLSATLDIDARRTPRVRATVVVAYPKAAELALLSPVRQDLRLAVYGGYKRITTGIVDQQRLSYLRVRTVVKDPVTQTVTLTAESDESVVVGQAAGQTFSYTTSDSVTTAVQAVVAAAFPGESQTWVVGIGSSLFPVAASIAVGDDLWNALTDWADTVQAKIWHDGLGTWYLTPAPTLPRSSTSHELRVGASSAANISDMQYTESRDGFASHLILRYDYTSSGTRHVDCAIAVTGLTPVSSVTVRRTVKPVDAARAAYNLLRRGLRRFYSVQVDGLGAWWIVPYDTVGVRGPGVSDRLLVEAVVFTLDQGTMRLTGQSPIAEHIPRISVTVTTTTP